MKKTAAFIIAAMLFCISAVSIFNILVSEEAPSEGTAIERLETSLSENIPFRSTLSGIMDTIRYISGVRSFDGTYIGESGVLLRDIEEPNSRIFSFAKNYILSFAEENQIKPYFMLVPTSAAVLRQEIDDYAENDFYNQRYMINRMYSEFDGKVRTADIYQTLYDHRDEYIYYNTEDLPTALGGYYIYGELCTRLGIRRNGMDSFSAAYAAHGFYGSLATDFLRHYAAPDFMTLYEYIGSDEGFTVRKFEKSGSVRTSDRIFDYNEENFADKTDMILGGEVPVIEITSGNYSGEGSSILIFGDESAKSWLPFLATNYEKLTFVNLEFANEKLLSGISANDFDQILFAYSTATFSSGIPFEKLEFMG